jgi:hypothetical protein
MSAARASALIAVSGLLSASLLLLLAPTAGAAGGLRFSSFPSRALSGGTATVAVTGAPAGDRCALAVAYAGGAGQRGLGTLVAGSRPVAWTWKVPGGTKSGTARVTVACKAAGRLARGLVVVGEVVPPKIDVVKQGFSTRTRFGRTAVSFGVVLANRSKTDDALDVSVLVNFVNESNALVGSASLSVDSIPAGAQYALGKSVTSLDGPVTVNRLEVVIQVGSGQPAVRTPQPTVLNGSIAPGTSDPTWVGSVRGELTNQARGLVLTRAAVSVVVLNAAGEVVGGGYGSMSGSLPPGAREFVRLTSGLDSILVSDAASLQFSVDPTYESD